MAQNSEVMFRHSTNIWKTSYKIAYKTHYYSWQSIYICSNFFNTLNPFPCPFFFYKSCQHQARLKWLQIENFVKLKACVYTVWLILIKAIVEYHRRWNRAEQYLAVAQDTLHIKQPSHFDMHRHIVFDKAKIIISIKKKQPNFHKQNVPQEPLDWIAREHVQINITDGFVWRNVIVHSDNIATLDMVVYNALLASYVGKTVIVHRRNIATRDTDVWNVLQET